jgi:hypothetical protein
MPDVDLYLAFRGAAESAIDRAHEAAADACGRELRQGLEDALQALADSIPLAPDPKTTARLQRAQRAIRQALEDFDKGALAELGALLEQARVDICSYDLPDG